MNLRVILLALLAGVMSSGSACGQTDVPNRANCSPPKQCGCPDNYCPKPLPRIWWLSCGEPCCYVPKPFPRIWVLCCSEQDNYCRKPCPSLNRPLRQDHYTCEPLGKGHHIIAGPPVDTKTPEQEN